MLTVCIPALSENDILLFTLISLKIISLSLSIHFNLILIVSLGISSNGLLKI